MRLRRPRRAVGPHVRELRRGPGAGRAGWRRSIDGLQGRGGPLVGRPRARHRRSTTPATATPEYDAAIAAANVAAVVRAAVHDRPGHHGDQPRRLRGASTSRRTRRAIRRHDVAQRDAVVLQRRLDRGRRRQPAQDARPPGAHHRRAQGRARLRRLRDLATGRASTRSPTRPTRQRRPHRRTRCGPASTPASTCSWSPTPRPQFVDLLLAEVDGRPGQRWRASTTPSGASCGRSSSSGSSSTRSPRRTTSTRSAAPSTARSPGEAVAESQVLLKNDGDVLPLDARRRHLRRRPQRRQHRQPGRRLDDRSGRACSGDIIPGTTILEGIREVGAGRDGHVQRRRLGADGRGTTSASSWSARRRTPRASATSAARSAASARPRSSGGEVAVRSSPATGRSSTRSARRSRRASCWSSRAARRCITDQLGEIDALVASWLPGSEGAGVADVLFGRAAVHRPAPDDLAAQRGPGADQRRRRATTTRCSRTAGACGPGSRYGQASAATEARAGDNRSGPRACDRP